MFHQRGSQTVTAGRWDDAHINELPLVVDRMIGQEQTTDIAPVAAGDEPAIRGENPSRLVAGQHILDTTDSVHRGAIAGVDVGFFDNRCEATWIAGIELDELDRARVSMPD